MLNAEEIILNHLKVKPASLDELALLLANKGFKESRRLAQFTFWDLLEKGKAFTNEELKVELVKVNLDLN